MGPLCPSIRKRPLSTQLLLLSWAIPTWRGKAILALLGPSVLPSSGNSWKITTVHTRQPCRPRLKPAPHNTDHDNEQGPKGTPTAEGSARKVSQESCTHSANHAGHNPARTSHCPRALPVSSSLTRRGINISARNDSLITIKFLPTVKMRPASGSEPPLPG